MAVAVAPQRVFVREAKDPVPTPAPRRGFHLRGAGLPWAVLVLCLVAFAFGAPTISSAPASQFGLLASASPLYGISILLAAVGFALAIRRGNMAAAVVGIIAMIACERLPRALSTEAPMYAWTYKHIGVVDLIQQNHALARGTDIYNGWPGLFALTAWFSDLTGLSAVDIAHWFTPFFHLAMAGLTYAAARAWRLSAEQALTAVFLVATLNWVEQDYFAPQATAMILALGLFTIVGLSRERRTAVALALVIFTAATITHQLTPFWILLAVGLLVVGRRMRPWWIVIPLAAIVIGFFFYNFDIVREYKLFSIDVFSNAQTNNPRVGVLGQVFTSTLMRILSGSMWAATALVLISRWRKRQPVWALGVLALSPILILGGQNYGGEAVFRVFLYSLPGCAIALAPALLAGLRSNGARFGTAFAVLLLTTGLAAQANFGSWFTNLVTRDELAAADAILAGSDFPAYIAPVVPVWPERSSANYVKYAKFNDKYDHSMMFQEDLLGLHFESDAEYDKLMEMIGSRTDGSTYLVFTDQMVNYGAYFGLFPYDAVPNLRKHLDKDPRWQVIDKEQDVAVYVHRVAVK
ncbi:hypothetical protein BH09ACT8_BH09ACT8_28460 [soil metagenome]